VIIQEDADDNNVMPDLSLPVRLVKQASDNLISVTLLFFYEFIFERIFFIKKFDQTGWL
jgi:hypothetical protein